jgi:hypothetical protein
MHDKSEQSASTLKRALEVLPNSQEVILGLSGNPDGRPSQIRAITRVGAPTMVSAVPPAICTGMIGDTRSLWLVCKPMFVSRL